MNNTAENVISLPPAERLRRGEVEREERQIQDIGGNPSAPFRAIDTLRRMELSGSISKKMREAGETFRDDFGLAGFVSLKAADMERLPGCATTRQVMTHRLIDAKDRAWTALQVLGGLTSPCGSLAWFVLGEQHSLEEWARIGWRHKALKPHTAKGILIGCLGALELHYEKVRK